MRRRENKPFQKKEQDKRFLINKYQPLGGGLGVPTARSHPLPRGSDAMSGGVALGTREGHGAGPGPVPAAPGRRHLQQQTDNWLEEITDRVDESDVGVQTDTFVR